MFPKFLNIKNGLCAAAAAALFGFGPALASAHDHVDLGLAFGPACPPATVVEQHTDQVWVDPVYRTEVDHVWQPECVQERVTDFWVPDRYETRWVEVGRHRMVEQQVLVEPGHMDQRHERVVVPAHWEDVPHQVLVTPGHYETRVVDEVHREPAHGFFSFFIR